MGKIAHRHSLMANENRPVPWLIRYADNSEFNSVQGAWITQAETLELDQYRLSVTKKSVKELLLEIEGVVHTITPPEPLPCFAFTRMRTSLGETSQDLWLYSVFGYMIQDLRYLTVIRPGWLESRIERRDEPSFYLV